MALRAELVERGAAPSEPQDTFYGLREVYVSDPDGFSLVFAQDISSG